MPFFSIIIPIYNVDSFLRKCIESVLNQDYHNYELILVDDGSTDNCPSICDSYKTIDNRVKVIHKANGGLSSARNFGVDIARGKYLLFLDSDDFWNNNKALKDLYDEIERQEQDVVLFGCINRDYFSGKEYVSRGFYDLQFIRQGKKDLVLEYLFKNGLFPGSAWVFAVRTTLVKNNHIRFPNKMTSEDCYWISNALYYADKIGAINNTFYTYIKNRKGSITSTAKLSSIEGVMYAISDWKSKTDMGHFGGITNFLAQSFLISVLSYNNLHHKDRKKACELMKKNLFILKKANIITFNIAYVIIQIIGFRLSSAIIEVAYKLIR